MTDLTYELTASRPILEQSRPDPVTIRIQQPREAGLWPQITVTGRRVGSIRLGFGYWADIVSFGGRCWVARRKCGYIDRYDVDYPDMVDPAQCPPWW